MERWEAINKLYTFCPKIGDDSYFKCLVCQFKLKTERGICRHIEIHHNTQINELRNEAIGSDDDKMIIKLEIEIDDKTLQKLEDYSEQKLLESEVKKHLEEVIEDHLRLIRI